MNTVDKIDIALVNVPADLSGIAPRKTIVHVEQRDDACVVLTDDGRCIGILESDINEIVNSYDVEIRSVKQSTSDQPAGHVVVRLRRKSSSQEQSRNDMKQCRGEFLRQVEGEGKGKVDDDDDLELLSKKQLEMIVARKELREAFQEKSLAEWVSKVVEAPNLKQQESIIEQLLSEPESSRVVEFVMNELSSNHDYAHE